MNEEASSHLAIIIESDFVESSNIDTICIRLLLTRTKTLMKNK